ncbi:MAG: hypothetical protein ABUL48_02940, partial [Pseudorhodoplanes sp.]
MGLLTAVMFLQHFSDIAECRLAKPLRLIQNSLNRLNPARGSVSTMLKIFRNAILACVVAVAANFAGVGPGFSQTAPTPPEPVASAPAAPSAQASAPAEKRKTKSVSHSASGERRHSGGRGYVYLLRGLLNVFSLGMDELASKLERRGVPAGVYEYGQWESLCNDAAARVRNGGGPIVIVGHSLGADAVVDMANKLGRMGVPVALVVAFDPTVSNVLTGSTTSTFINYYQSDNGFGRPVSRGRGFHGTLINDDLRRHT